MFAIIFNLKLVLGEGSNLSTRQSTFTVLMLVKLLQFKLPVKSLLLVALFVERHLDLDLTNNTKLGRRGSYNHRAVSRIPLRNYAFNHVFCFILPFCQVSKMLPLASKFLRLTSGFTLHVSRATTQTSLFLFFSCIPINTIFCNYMVFSNTTS